MQNMVAIVSKLRSCSSSWRVSSPIKFEGGLRGRGREGQHTQTQTRGDPDPLLRGHAFNPSPVQQSMDCRPVNLSPSAPPSPLEEKCQGNSTGGRGIKATPSLTSQSQYQPHLHQAAPLLV